MTHRYFQNQLVGAVEPCSDATKLKEELDEDLVLCVVSSWLISSGAQSGRSGICVAFGVVFFYFGSVVGPCLYLDDVMLYSCNCVKWRL